MRLPLGDLYDRDFYQWTQEQAVLLRERAVGRLDWERLAGEIGDMGASDFRECLSRVRTIIEHLYKLAWSRRIEPRGGWEATIITQRADLELVLTASLRAKVLGELERTHKTAARAAARAFSTEETDTIPDSALRWTLPQILGEENDPLATSP
ncbi:MAG: DUF29 domain-containing protein [Pseudomonadota bacterium]